MFPDGNDPTQSAELVMDVRGEGCWSFFLDHVKDWNQV